MKRLLVAPAAVLALAFHWACTSDPITPPSGQFVGPTGLGLTSAGDRDLLFITSTGTDELRALQICATPLLDGGVVDPNDTCPRREDFQFLPGPVRVFGGTVETGDRPIRLAGVRLLRRDAQNNQSNAGVAIAAGADATLRVVDARGLVEAVNARAAAPLTLTFPLDTPAVDVVAANPLDPITGIELGADVARAFVVTRPGSATPAQILVLQVSLDKSGKAQLPTELQRCNLTGVVPRRLAVVPGASDAVWVADGSGDGVLRVDFSAAPAGGVPECTARRIAAGGPVRALALSPTWYKYVTYPDPKPAAVIEHPAGEIVLMVRDDGAVVLARTADGKQLSIPPYDFDDPTRPAMEPLHIGGLARDATFLHSVKPGQLVGGVVCGQPPCTPLFVGQLGATSAAKLQRFDLLAAVTAADGGTYFLDVPNRRLVDENYFGADPSSLHPKVTTAIGLDPNPVGNTTAPLVFAPKDALPGHEVDGWFNAGVTLNAKWQLVWHSAMPGLERRSGTVTRTAAGTLRLDSPSQDFGRFQADPVLQLAVGDVVSFAGLFIDDTASAGCLALRSETPGRFELPIVAIGPGSLELGTLPDTATTAGFNPDCARFGAVVEVRSAGDKPWLIYEGTGVRARAKSNQLVAVKGIRFDYPLDYAENIQPLVPTPDTDISAAFTITLPDPTVRTTITFSLSSGQAPTVGRDPSNAQGLASQVVAYSSPRVTNLLFTALTGTNAIIQSSPELLPYTGGVIAYR